MSDMLRLVTETGHAGGARGSSLFVDARPPVPKIDLEPTVQAEVIPRLRQALERTLAKPPHPLVAGTASQQDVNALATRLVSGDIAGGIAIVDALRCRNVSLDVIYLKVLAPTACHLHQMWSDDLLGLADATIAFCNLRSLLHHYGPEFYGQAKRQETGLRALLVSPTAQRSMDVGLPLFGLLFMSEFFRREGWDAWVERGLTSGNFRDTVLSGWFDLVEVLATSDKELDEIASGIRIIRRGSPNPAIGVIVCGEIFRQHPEFVGLVGADLVASDPLSSLSQAKHFVSHQTPHRRLA